MHCKQLYEPAENVLRELELEPGEVGGKKFAHGKGCTECNFTGFRGRIALGELMSLDERLRQLILENASSEQLQRAAVEGGMITLREAGLRAIFDGLTTVEEVLRETLYRS